LNSLGYGKIEAHVYQYYQHSVIDFIGFIQQRMYYIIWMEL